MTIPSDRIPTSTRLPSSPPDTPSAREVEVLLRVAFDDAPIGMALTSLDGRWVRVNQALCELLGYSEEEMLRTNFAAITHPDDLELSVRMHREMLAGERTRYRIEKRYFRRDGQSVWTSLTVTSLRTSAGTAEHVMAQIVDVSERVMAIEALREGENVHRRQSETLQAIVDHIPAMVTFTSPSGRPVFANREWERLTGYDVNEFLGQELFGKLYPNADDREHVREFMREANGSLGDFRMRTRDGRMLDTVWANVKLSDGSVVGVAQDVTERRQLEDQLRHAQKMEAIGRLAGGVAHDFNNLLTVIRSYGDFIAAELPAESMLHADLSEILGAADRAAALTRQLLAFSRRQMLQPRLVDVNRKVSNVAGMLRRIIGEDIALETVLDSATWPVLADAGQLEQVLLNLAVNARDAMPSGGTLTIRTERVSIDEARSRCRPELVAGEYMSIVVEDTGVGISNDMLTRIFEPFFTTKGPGKGTGLGLATAYGIVKQSGGCIYVDSIVGRGSRFTVLLPRSEKVADPVSEPPSSLPMGRETILVVEDDRPVRAAVRRTLEGLGYRVHEAASGAEALGTLEASLDRVHLLLTDVVMPDIQGRQLAECMLERHAGQRVLYMSGYTEDEILRRGLEDPRTLLLQKPFTAEELATAVRRALDD